MALVTSLVGALDATAKAMVSVSWIDMVLVPSPKNGNSVVKCGLARLVGGRDTVGQVALELADEGSVFLAHGSALKLTNESKGTCMTGLGLRWVFSECHCQVHRSVFG